MFNIDFQLLKNKFYLIKDLYIVFLFSKMKRIYLEYNYKSKQFYITYGKQIECTSNKENFDYYNFYGMSFVIKQSNNVTRKRINTMMSFLLNRKLQVDCQLLY